MSRKRLWKNMNKYPTILVLQNAKLIMIDGDRDKQCY